MVNLIITISVIFVAVVATLLYMLRNVVIKNEKIIAHDNKLFDDLVTAYEVIASREAYIEVVNDQLKLAIDDIKNQDTWGIYKSDEFMSTVYDQFVALANSLDSVLKEYKSELKTIE